MLCVGGVSHITYNWKVICNVINDRALLIFNNPNLNLTFSSGDELRSVCEHSLHWLLPTECIIYILIQL